MTTVPGFPGFPPGTARFLADLAMNNDREWFAANKARYQEDVVAPARAFITAVGSRLREFAPHVVADPRINGSLFRQNRDTRFSHDKTPFKTHLGMWLWEGELERMECSGFYLHVEPPNLMVAAGLYLFPKPLLHAWRESLANPRHGPALARAVAEVRAAGPYNVMGEHYKRVPPGYAAPPELADWLRYNGLYAGIELPMKGTLESAGFLDLAVEHFRNLAPLHRWLVDMTRRVGG